jgi:Recombinase
VRHSVLSQTAATTPALWVKTASYRGNGRDSLRKGGGSFARNLQSFHWKQAKQIMIKKLTACPGWLGLSEDRTSFIFIPERAEVVRRIFEASISGLGGYTIAKQLNTKKVPPFGPSSKWDQSTIHNLLRNRATIGEHQPKQYRNRKEFPVGDPVPGYYPPVIDEGVFQAAQVARQKNLASGRGRKGRLITNLFAGIPTCAYCGSAVKFYSNGHAKSLVCSRLLTGGSCYRMAWSYRDFENSFLEFVKARQSSLTIEPRERETLSQLMDHVRSLAGPDVRDVRLAIATELKAIVSDLKIASAGSSPKVGKPDARIRRNGPGRYFEVTFRGGTTHTGFPIVD